MGVRTLEYLVFAWLLSVVSAQAASTVMPTPILTLLDTFQDQVLWILIVGFISAFILAFGIGANDVANAFGTAVGAKVLNLRQACYIATVFEMLGCCLLAMLPEFTPEVVWIVVLGFIVSFLLAFGIGANDVANSFGTSVGAKVLTLRQACLLASVFELAGSILIGYKVSDTIRKGIMDVNIYEGSEKELMLGSLAALSGSAIWLLVATFFKLPISGTHSIVGSTLGYTLVARGGLGIHWTMIGKIVASWFISPLLSGIISVLIFVCIRRLILSKSKPLEPGLRALPIFYFLTLFINIFSVVLDGPSLLYFDRIDWWGAVLIALAISLIAALVVQFYIVPRQRKAILADEAKRKQKGEVNFKLGGSTGEESNTTPADSRAISLEDLTAVGKPESVDNHNLKVPTMYCFPAQCETIEDAAYKGVLVNGNKHNAVEKETALTMNGSVVKENGTEKVTTQTKHGVLGVPNSPTSESLGLQHNSSQIPLVPNGKTKEVFIPMSDDERDNGKFDESSDKPETAKLFSFLQILTASFGSFAHGGNDVSNAIGPLVALWLIYYRGSVKQQDETPWYILVYGGIGISIGLWVWGRRVIKTLGEDLTKLTPSSGFTIEIGSALTVLTASKIGIPISTTHCKVGSVVFVGWVRSRQGVDWRLFRNIVFAWIITLPVAGGLSALIMFILRELAL
uniref:Phosphate transporter n=1 Tax=Strigamia maritima TaxID=126957 RepID=T1JHU7_STRMM